MKSLVGIYKRMKVYIDVFLSDLNDIMCVGSILPPMLMEEDMELDFMEGEEGEPMEERFITSFHQHGTVEDVEILRAKSRDSEQQSLFEFEEVNIHVEIEGVDLMRTAMEVPLVMERVSPVEVSPIITRDATPEVDILGSILGNN